MNKEQFKKEIFTWLKKEKIDISNKRYRIYNYSGNWELRIYNEPMELDNVRKSFRETSRDENGRYGIYGIHKTKITTYIHISEEDLKNKEERDFILEMIKDNL